MHDDSTLRLAIGERSLEDAERFISLLRDSRLAVRPSRIEDVEELQALLEKSPVDMVACDLAAERLPVSQIAETIGRSGKDVPIIGITDQRLADVLPEALSNGARDVVHRDLDVHIQHVVRRELADLQNRRRARRFEASLRESERRCNALLESSQEAIAYVHEGMHVYANPAYLDLFQFHALDDIEGTPILDLVARDDHDKLKHVLRQLSRGEKPPDTLELQARRQDGSTFSALLEMSSASIEGEPCTQILARNKSAAAEATRESGDLHRQDLLTGLYNRQYFSEELDRAISEAVDGQQTAVLGYVDIDEFTATSELVGISGTDLIIGDIASVIQSQIGDRGLVARFGDHTFTLLLRGHTLQDAEARAEQLRATFENHISEVAERSVNVTCSIGLAPIAESASKGQEIVSHAATAAAKAQKAGGNRVRVHDPVAEQKADEAAGQHWVHLLKESLRRDSFLCVYQPIVSLHGEPGERYEVLLRMRGPKDEEFHPSYFMPVAERHGMLGQLDNWVIEHGIRTLAERRQQGHETHFFINLTSATLCDERTLNRISQLLKQYRLSGEHLIFEAPEHAVSTNIKPVRRFAQGLQQLRCQLCLSQFGSGLSSFQLLKHLPVDYVKIDHSYMADLPSSEENQQKVREISDQVHAAGKITIAEYVENAMSMPILWQIGVNFVQGHFLQEPQREMGYDFGA